MRVKCYLCDKIDLLHEENAVAKRLKNRPIHTYLCYDCNERIRVKTVARLETGKFRLYRDPKVEEEW